MLHRWGWNLVWRSHVNSFMPNFTLTGAGVEYGTTKTKFYQIWEHKKCPGGLYSLHNSDEIFKVIYPIHVFYLVAFIQGLQKLWALTYGVFLIIFSAPSNETMANQKNLGRCKNWYRPLLSLWLSMVRLRLCMLPRSQKIRCSVFLFVHHAFEWYSM